jgi:hypothetical protein
MKEIKDTIFTIAIIALFVIVILQQCKNKADVSPPASTTTSKSDTTSSPVRGSGEIHQAPNPIINVVLPPTQQQSQGVDRIIYQNDTVTIRQVLTEFFSKNVSTTKLPIDTIGSVTITDTISKNTIAGRSYSYNLKYPVITNTVTIREPYNPQRKVYVGGGFQANKTDLINQFKAGLLYQDRHDRIFKANGTINMQAQVGIDLETYWKIRLRRK